MSSSDNDGVAGSVREALLAARGYGFLGPGPIDRQLIHAKGFVDLAKSQPQSMQEPHVLDLGSGGGLPGLVLADQWPEVVLVLLDANQRRTDFLQGAVISCGFQDRVHVVQLRAEVGGRDPLLRGAFDGVVVRSFGPPAVVAECAAPFLRQGGWLIVSEPPAEELSFDDRSGVDPGAFLRASLMNRVAGRRNRSLSSVSPPWSFFGGSSAIRCCATRRGAVRVATACRAGKALKRKPEEPNGVGVAERRRRRGRSLVPRGRVRRPKGGNVSRGTLPRTSGALCCSQRQASIHLGPDPPPSGHFEARSFVSGHIGDLAGGMTRAQ